jgi:hypothetical protein
MHVLSQQAPLYTLPCKFRLANLVTPLFAYFTALIANWIGRPQVAVPWLALLLCISEVSDSKLDPEPGYIVSFTDFPQYLQDIQDKYLKISHGLSLQTLSNELRIGHPLTDVMYPELLTGFKTI